MLKPRLEKFYEKIVCEDFILLYNFKNVSGLTSFEKAILNSTSNNFASNSVAVMQSFSAWLIGTSQKCVSTRSRKSIATFEIRKSNLLGLKVTCRKRNLFVLLDKLLVWVLPRLLSASKENSFSNNKPKRSIVESSLLEQNPRSSSLENTFKLISPGDKENKRKQNGFLFEDQSNTVFVISNKSALAFPEVSQLNTFFDNLSGFALSCSISRKKECSTIRGTKSEEKPMQMFLQIHDNYHVKKQFLSAFQYPEIFLESNTKKNK